jgi:hypothetical protein
MHPKNRMEKAVALGAIADAAEEMEKAGASNLDVTQYPTRRDLLYRKKERVGWVTLIRLC